MSGASATTLSTSESIKAYVDAQVTLQDLDLSDGTDTISVDLDSETLSILGGTGVTSTATGNGVTLAIDGTVATKDIEFPNEHLDYGKGLLGKPNCCLLWHTWRSQGMAGNP